jgi:Glycosyl transferases group 1
MLSVRDGLRTAFTTPEGIDVPSVREWAENHAKEDYGLHLDYLIAQGERHFARVATSDDPVNASALDAVMAAHPTDTSATIAEQQALFERIGQIGKIDLVLVGSGHPANIASFDWFIKTVYFPYLAQSGRSLFVVGSVCNHLRHHVHPNLVFLGRCRRIEPLLRASRACPLPVIAGSGSPIKTIPALAVNGAVTVTDRIENSFGLAEYGIPSFADPKAFADDLHSLLTNDVLRNNRIRAARRYVDDRLTWGGYVEFWRQCTGIAERTITVGVDGFEVPNSAGNALAEGSSSGTTVAHSEEPSLAEAPSSRPGVPSLVGTNQTELAGSA